MAPNDSDRGRPRAHLFSYRLLQITIPDHLDEQEHSTVLRRQRSLRHAVSAISAEPEPTWILTIQAATLSSHTGRIIRRDALNGFRSDWRRHCEARPARRSNLDPLSAQRPEIASLSLTRNKMVQGCDT